MNIDTTATCHCSVEELVAERHRMPSVDIFFRQSAEAHHQEGDRRALGRLIEPNSFNGAMWATLLLVPSCYTMFFWCACVQAWCWNISAAPFPQVNMFICLSVLKLASSLLEANLSDLPCCQRDRWLQGVQFDWLSACWLPINR